jgi:hypothetical protein
MAEHAARVHLAVVGYRRHRHSLALYVLQHHVHALLPSGLFAHLCELLLRLEPSASASKDAAQTAPVIQRSLNNVARDGARAVACAH